MDQSVETLLTAVLALPAEDRLEFAEALLASLPANDRPPFDELWREAIHRRSAELRSGVVSGVPWVEVKRQAREQAGG